MAAKKAAGGNGPQVPHYFQMMKDLTILGYFTSEVACTQLLGWVEVSGRFDGNVLYERKRQPAARPSSLRVRLAFTEYRNEAGKIGW